MELQLTDLGMDAIFFFFFFHGGWLSAPGETVKSAADFLSLCLDCWENKQVLYLTDGQ